MKLILSVITFAIIISVISQSKASDRYIVAPGQEVIVGRIPKGKKLDQFGCTYIDTSIYRCYSGQLEGMQFTSQQEAIAAARFIHNPSSMKKPPNTAKPQ